MSEIDWSVVSAVASSLTAVVAIMAPVVTSVLAAKSQERIKKMELNAPRLYDAIADMFQSYAQLVRAEDCAGGSDGERLYKQAKAHYHTFATSAYKVMALIPDSVIQQQISNLLNELRDFGGLVTESHDAIFGTLTSDLNEYLLTSKVKKKKQRAKDQV